MKEPFSFDLEERFWNQTLEQLAARTEYSEEELRRGLTYMVGRRAGRMMQEIAQGEDPQLMRELEIAILHSSEEK